MYKIFKIWPEFSGSLDYPIICTGWFSPTNVYVHARASYRLWDIGTEYGRNRYKLLDFMIKTVQDMIDFIDETIEEEEDDYE